MNFYGADQDAYYRKRIAARISE